MTLHEHALRSPVLVVGDACEVDVGLPWYRSMPIASVLAVELSVDGAAAADARLEACDGASWFLQDRRTIHWRGAPKGDTAELVLRVRLHLPYLSGPEGGSIQVLQEARAVLPVERAS